MSLDNAKNFAKVTVSTGYDNATTSIVLTTGHGAKLPTAPFNVVWWNATDYADPTDDPNVEIVRVTAISTDTLTVTRAQESTSAATHNTAGKTYKMIAGLTAKVINTDMPAAFGGAWTLKSYSDNGGTAVASLTVSSLNLETDKLYKVIWTALDGSSLSVDVACQPNAENTGLLFVRNRTTSTNTVYQSTNEPQWVIAGGSGANANGEFVISKNASGKYYACGEGMLFDGTNVVVDKWGGAAPNTTNLTSLVFKSSNGTATFKWKIWILIPKTA